MADSLDQNKPTLFDDFSYTGYWWRPGEDEKISGRVSYSPSTGIKLELAVFSIDDNYDENNIPKQFEIPFNVEIFHGIVSGYPYRITLLQNRATRIGARESTGLVPYFFRSETMFAGQHFSSPTEKNIDTLYVTYSYLQNWMGNEMPIISRAYKVHNEIRVFAVPSIDSTISFHEWTSGPSNRYEHRIRRENYIKLKPNQARSFKWFRNNINNIRDLLVFLTGIPIETKSISSNLAGSTRSISAKGLEIYFQVHVPKVREFFIPTIPFNLNNLGENDPEVFRTWFDLDKQLLISFHLCLDVINSGGTFPKYDFLALVYSLENYHRFKFKSNTSLSNRLKKLNKKIPDYIRHDLEFDDIYLNAIEATRDYYSHYDPNIISNKNVLSGNDLYEVITRLILFNAYFLYRELSIKEENIKEAFRIAKFRGMWQRNWPTSSQFIKVT